MRGGSIAVLGALALVSLNGVCGAPPGWVIPPPPGGPTVYTINVVARDIGLCERAIPGHRNPDSGVFTIEITVGRCCRP